MATITQRVLTNTKYTITSRAISITVPTTAKISDTVLYMFASSSATDTLTPPAGWNIIKVVATSTVMYTMYKRLVAGDPGKVISVGGLAATGPTSIIVGCAVYGGVKAVPLGSMSLQNLYQFAWLSVNCPVGSIPIYGQLAYDYNGASASLSNIVFTVPAGITGSYTYSGTGTYDRGLWFGYGSPVMTGQTYSNYATATGGNGGVSGISACMVLVPDGDVFLLGNTDTPYRAVRCGTVGGMSYWLGTKNASASTRNEVNGTTRTNYCLTPNGLVSGKAGVRASCTLSLNSGLGPTGVAGFFRWTASANNTAGWGFTSNYSSATTDMVPVTGYGPTGAVFTYSGWVRASKACTVSIQAQTIAYPSTSTNANAALNLPVSANVWTQFSLTTSANTATCDSVVISAWFGSTGSTYGVTGDTIDVANILVEKSGTAGTYFDGNALSTDDIGIIYTP